MSNIKSTTWVCNTCGSKEVEERVWRDCNTGEYSGTGEAEDDDCWCKNCEATCKIVDINDYKTIENENH